MLGRGFDFANHFVEFSIDYDVHEAPFYTITPENFPEKEDMIKFFVNYIGELSPKTMDKDVADQAEAVYQVGEISLFGALVRTIFRNEKFTSLTLHLFILRFFLRIFKGSTFLMRFYLQETMPFVPVSHIFWGVWGLLQVELSPVGFGFAVGLIHCDTMK